MKSQRKKRILIAIGVLLALLIAAVLGAHLMLKKGTAPAPVDTKGAVLSVTQDGDTIVFQPDNSYTLQGVVNIEGYDFAYTTKGTYDVRDGSLILNEAAPTVSVSSTFGDFDMEGDIQTSIKKGALNILLKATNEEQNTFELADLSLGKEQADKLGVKGVTAASKSDSGSTKDKDKTEKAAKKAKKAGLSTGNALLVTESSGAKLAFYPDGTCRLVGDFIQSGEGLTVDINYSIDSSYSVKDGVLSMPSKTTAILNADLFAQYGKVDVESPGTTKVSVSDGRQVIEFSFTADGQMKKVATFRLGKEDAEKLGIKGITGNTVSEKAAAAASTGTSSKGSSKGPAQAAIAKGAKPVSFSNGAYTITFYSNGQYKESGTLTLAGNKVTATVSDTYTLSSDGLPTLRTANQATASVPSYNISFGVKNKSTATKDGSGCTVKFTLDADGTIYNAGSVNLSAGDLKKIRDNYTGNTAASGKDAGKADKTSDSQGSEASTPDDTVIKLKSLNGIELRLNTEDHTYELRGSSKLLGKKVMSYRNMKKGSWSVRNGKLVLKPTELKVVSKEPLTEPLDGVYKATFQVAPGLCGTYVITLHVGDPAPTFLLSSAQAKQLGLK